MYELPLFLLNTVLFPGIPLRLQVFEPRYRIMILDCLDTRTHFGVVLIRKGMETFDPSVEPYWVGCTAQMMQVEKVDEERINIRTTGIERFRILSIDRNSKPYLLGIVEPYPLIRQDRREIVQKAGVLSEWVQRYLKILKESGVDHYHIDQAPYEPIKFAYLAAALLRIPLKKKQEILSITQAVDLVEDLCVIYRHELAILKALLSNGFESVSTFSKN